MLSGSVLISLPYELASFFHANFLLPYAFDGNNIPTEFLQTRHAMEND